MSSMLDNAIDIVMKKLGYNGVKNLQCEILHEVIAGQDVFGCLLFLFDKIYKPDEPTIVCMILSIVYML